MFQLNEKHQCRSCIRQNTYDCGCSFCNEKFYNSSITPEDFLFCKGCDKKYVKVCLKAEHGKCGKPSCLKFATKVENVCGFCGCKKGHSRLLGDDETEVETFTLDSHWIGRKPRDHWHVVNYKDQTWRVVNDTKKCYPWWDMMVVQQYGYSRTRD